MGSCKKLGVALVAVLLVCGAAPLSSDAQTRSLSNVFQFSSTGAYLGIQMDDVTAANMSQYKLSSEKGVIVRRVEEGSPADSAGLQEDDVILEYGGYQVWSAIQLSRLVEETPPGRKVGLVVSRDGKRVPLTAEIGTRYGSRSQNRMQIMPEDFYGQLFRGLPFRSPNSGNYSAEAPPEKPRLGLSLLPLSDQLGEHLGVPGKKGALVSSVLESSPSAGKLRSGDVIIGADGNEIREPEDLIRLVRDKTSGDLTLKVIRDKKEITVVVNLPALPAGEGAGIKL